MNEVNQRNNENNVMVKAINESLDKMIEKFYNIKNDNSKIDMDKKLNFNNIYIKDDDKNENINENQNSNKIGF